MKTREEALAVLHEFTKGDSLRKHALAVEQAMKACAAKYAPEEGQAHRPRSAPANAPVLPFRVP